VKKCNKCQTEKALTEFATNNAKPDGKQAYCRKCSTLWAREKYQSDPNRRLTIVKRNERLRIRNQTEIENYLEGKSCVDCGITNKVVLTFDHRENKRGTVSDMVLHGYSLNTIYEEIAKCDIRCFNCHMIKDSKRRGGLKWRGTLQPQQPPV
jgi:hypothetical protein